jgi:hypothetical protein
MESKINFDYNKVIVVYFDPGHGGKFLINSLGLSKEVFFQHNRLVQLQLENNFDFDKKVSFLHKRMEMVPNTKWDDLGLCDYRLFGISSEDDCRFPCSQINIEKFKDNPVLIKVTNESTKYLFLTAHGKVELDLVLNLWKNAKVIKFSRGNLFYKIRNWYSQKIATVWDVIDKSSWPEYYQNVKGSFLSLENMSKFPKQIHSDIKLNLRNTEFVEKVKEQRKKDSFEFIWNKLRDDDWEQTPPQTLRGYISYPEELKIKIEEKFAEEFSQEDENVNAIYDWNVNWYFSKESTLMNIKKIYDLLQLTEFNEDKISKYYDLWIDKLDEIKINSLNKEG